MGRGRRGRKDSAIRKFFGRLSPLERVAIVMSGLYSLGMAILIQYNSQSLGLALVDYLRLKPILVGISYMIYLAIPAALFIGPLFLMSWKKGLGTAGKIVFFLFYTVIMAWALPTTMCYFFPFMHVGRFYPQSLWGIWAINFSDFWFLYWTADVAYWIGMSCCLLASALLVERLAGRELLPWLPWRNSRSAMPILLVVGGTILIYYFNHNVYRNLSQSIGGGAPIAGIMTYRKSVPDTAEGDGSAANAPRIVEETIPCWLLSTEGGRHVFYEIRSEIYPYDVNPGKTSMAVSIPSDTVTRFVNLPHSWMYKVNEAPVFYGEGIMGRVHRLDAIVRLLYRKTESEKGSDKAAEHSTALGRSENSIEWVMKLGDWPLMNARMSFIDLRDNEDGMADVFLGFTGIQIPAGMEVNDLCHYMQEPLYYKGSELGYYPLCMQLSNVPKLKGYELISSKPMIRANYFVQRVPKGLETGLSSDGNGIVWTRRRRPPEQTAKP